VTTTTGSTTTSTSTTTTTLAPYGSPSAAFVRSVAGLID
jgi:hypothetical protein